jgi:hypothetical protein
MANLLDIGSCRFADHPKEPSVMTNTQQRIDTATPPALPRRDLRPVEREDARVRHLREIRAWAARVVEARYATVDLCSLLHGRLRHLSPDVDASLHRHQMNAREEHQAARVELAEVEALLAAEGVPSLADQADLLAMRWDDSEGTRERVERDIVALEVLVGELQSARERLRDVL